MELSSGLAGVLVGPEIEEEHYGGSGWNCRWDW
jgi:hypothetical protein